MTRILLTRHLAISLLALVLAGCTTPSAVRTPDKPSRPPENPRQDLVYDLLEEARVAFASNRLTTPNEDNAYFRYLQVLAIDPDNAAAEDGINAIVEQYLSWAIDNAREGRFSKAANYVGKASSVDPEHPNIAPVIRLINDSRQQGDRTFRLDRTALRNRAVDPDTFEAIVQEILRGESFVIIRAPDDASGRWLYQQLNNLTSTRVQASLEIGIPPAVIVTH